MSVPVVLTSMPFSLPDPPPPPCELCTVFMVSIWYFDHNAAAIPYRRRQCCAVCGAKTPCQTPNRFHCARVAVVAYTVIIGDPQPSFGENARERSPSKPEKYNVTHYSTAIRVRWYHLENSTSTGKDEKYLWPLVDFQPTDLMCFAIGLTMSTNNCSTNRRDSWAYSKMNTDHRWLDPASDIVYFIIHTNFSIRISNNKWLMSIISPTIHYETVEKILNNI